jgi:hypothetical protein
MTQRLLKPLWIVVALLFLLEAWLWDRIQPVIAWLIANLPLQAFKVALARNVARLPAAIVIFLFALPELIGLPLQFFALWLVAKGAVIIGTILFILFKGLGLALALILFEACKEKLMELSWFRYAYGQVIRARAWAKVQVQPIIYKIKALRDGIARGVKAILGEGSFLEKLRRIRAVAKRRAPRL